MFRFEPLLVANPIQEQVFAGVANELELDADHAFLVVPRHISQAADERTGTQLKREVDQRRSPDGVTVLWVCVPSANEGFQCSRMSSANGRQCSTSSKLGKPLNNPRLALYSSLYP
jgi:hypothetical protein